MKVSPNRGYIKSQNSGDQRVALKADGKISMPGILCQAAKGEKRLYRQYVNTFVGDARTAASPEFNRCRTTERL